MKTPVAVTLIVCGVILAALPPLSDAWFALLAARLLEHGAKSVSIEGHMGDMYRFGCWLLGAAMIGIAVITSLAHAREPLPRPLAPTAG